MLPSRAVNTGVNILLHVSVDFFRIVSRRYMAEILPKQRKTLSNQSIIPSNGKLKFFPHFSSCLQFYEFIDVNFRYLSLNLLGQLWVLQEVELDVDPLQGFPP